LSLVGSVFLNVSDFSRSGFRAFPLPVRPGVIDVGLKLEGVVEQMSELQVREHADQAVLPLHLRKSRRDKVINCESLGLNLQRLRDVLAFGELCVPSDAPDSFNKGFLHFIRTLFGEAHVHDSLSLFGQKNEAIELLRIHLQTSS